MKKPKANPETEYRKALAYYEQTVLKYVGQLPLTGTQYHVALRVWERLDTAHRAWFDSLGAMEKGGANATEPDICALKPRRLERDDTITAELLAKMASARLDTQRPSSIQTAVEDAHRILVVSRDYLRSLPEPKKKVGAMLEAYCAVVSFGDILDSSGKPDRIPLLPPVQASRNGGRITSRALEQALKRYAAGPGKMARRQICQSLKDKEICCRLLEDIRWHRFRSHH